jgi:predicted DNA binding CopG/RHH family protein
MLLIFMKQTKNTTCIWPYMAHFKVHKPTKEQITLFWMLSTKILQYNSITLKCESKYLHSVHTQMSAMGLCFQDIISSKLCIVLF